MSVPGDSGPTGQRGFTLVELMVALVIGLLIVLGAGQLLLFGIQSFRQIEELGQRQAALLFATDTLIRDIRRAESVDDRDDGKVLDLTFLDDEPDRTYSLNRSDGEESWSLYLEEEGDNQPLIDGFAEEGFIAGDEDPVWMITFTLQKDRGKEEDIEFYAVNRSHAIAMAYAALDDDEGSGGSGGSGGGGSGGEEGEEDNEGDEEDNEGSEEGGEEDCAKNGGWGPGGKPDECK